MDTMQKCIMPKLVGIIRFILFDYKNKNIANPCKIKTSPTLDFARISDIFYSIVRTITDFGGIQVYT